MINASEVIQNIPRKTAHLLNPIISETSRENTLHSAANLLSNMGSIATEVSDKGLSVPHIYLIFDTVAAAIQYEKIYALTNSA